MKRASSSTMADSAELPPFAPPNHRKKKTRELPNLSDCHCCNVRINCTNPKNRLQILASEWRIVLLCKSCYNLVESSKYCSYCLTRVSSSSMESCYECKKCHRRIHKQCVSMFSFDSGNGNGNGSSSSSSDEFSVCFDCWIPKLVENDINARVLDNRSKRKGVKVCGESMNSLGSSGVCNSQDKGKALEDAGVVAQKKVAAALEAKAKALDKELDARRAVVLASSAVGLVGVDTGGDRQGSVVDDDAQLAIRLHRAMNSSPRILRNSCLLNTHCVDVPEVNGCFDCLDSRAAVETSCSGRPINSRDDERNGLLETRQECEHQCARTQDEKNIDCVGGLIKYSRKGRRPLEVKCKEEPDCFLDPSNWGWSSGDARSKEKPDCFPSSSNGGWSSGDARSKEKLDCFPGSSNGGWSSGDARSKEKPDCFPGSSNGGWSSGDARSKEDPDCSLRTYRRRLKKDKQCKMELGHCSKTYSRRHSVIPNLKSNLTYGSCNMDNGTCGRAISLKCCEESRSLTNAS